MRLGWPTLYGQKHRARPTPIVNPFPQKFFLAHSCMFKKTSSNDGRRVCVEANQVQRTLAGETAARASGRGARGDVGCAGGTTGGPLGRGGAPAAARLWLDGPGRHRTPSRKRPAPGSRGPAVPRPPAGDGRTGEAAAGPGGAPGPDGGGGSPVGARETACGGRGGAAGEWGGGGARAAGPKRGHSTP